MGGDGARKAIPPTAIGRNKAVIYVARVTANRRLATCVVASLLLTAFSLAFAAFDLGAVLCVGIALFTGLSLLVRAFAKKGTATPHNPLRIGSLSSCADTRADTLFISSRPYPVVSPVWRL